MTEEAPPAARAARRARTWTRCAPRRRSRDFQPVPLGVTHRACALENEVTRRTSANVIGRLPGSDPTLAKEAVVYTAHHDHSGIKAGAKPGETRSTTARSTTPPASPRCSPWRRPSPRCPRGRTRSILFASVAARGAGPAGIAVPGGRTRRCRRAASPPTSTSTALNIWGRTRDVTVIGLGKSILDDWSSALAAMQGRERRAGGQFPDKGCFYRSDQFSFARIGVPAAYLEAGTDVHRPAARLGPRAAAGRVRGRSTTTSPPTSSRRTGTSRARSRTRSSCSCSALKVANAPLAPSWRPGDEFEAARKKALAELGR